MSAAPATPQPRKRAARAAAQPVALHNPAPDATPAVRAAAKSKPRTRKPKPGQTEAVARVVGVENQPVGRVQWLPRASLSANDYNPNHVAPIEMELLATSIREDGWTQPIVARSDGTIVDGFHRWSVSARPDIAAMTGGLVPVVTLADEVDPRHQRMSTIRHNRARGSHGVLRMAEIVRDLIDKGCTPAELIARLGMEDEEVDRLYDRGGMIKRGSRATFNTGWVPQ